MNTKLRLTIIAVCLGSLLFCPLFAHAQTNAQLEAINELQSELERWKDQGRGDDIRIIDQNRDAVSAQIKAGKLDLQSIVDAHKAAGKAAAQQSPKKQKAKPRNVLPVPTSTAMLKAGNRPIKAVNRVERTLKGFPAILTTTVHMNLVFSNGNVVSCSDWDPTQYDPTPQSVGQLDNCTVSRNAGDGDKINGFKKGERIHLSFGNINAANYGLDSENSSTLSGGSLMMKKDGRIAIGSFSTFSVSSDSAFGAGGRTATPIEGHYELDGHIIKITTDEGQVLHGFIGWASYSGSSGIDHIYFNGKSYWDRSK